MSLADFRSDPESVFLNVPFDREFAPLFVALIAGLTALGRKPRCVLEVPSAGEDRLDRIFNLLASCGASIHDLSRVDLSSPVQVPRFNMPFELGLAYVLSRETAHQFFVFEADPHRLQVSLSDLNGHDPHVHGNRVRGVLRCLLDCFAMAGSTPDLARLETTTKLLQRIVLLLQLEQGVEDPFHPYLFRQAVDSATRIAQTRGFVE